MDEYTGLPQGDLVTSPTIYPIPPHRHNGIDSPRIMQSDIEGATASGPSITFYDVTMGSAAIDNTEHDLISFSVPANSMSDGDLLKINFTDTYQYNGGTSTTLIIKIYMGSASTTLFNGTAPNSATTYKNIFEVTTQRNGTKLYVCTGAQAPDTQIFQTPNSTNAVDITPDFTIAQTVRITAKFTTTDSGTGLVPGTAKAYKL